uniref:ZP domain-containing protein n=1 Tax=Panagrolaimus sp. JU765 TaxID=591449 RepID=A0AC34Q989_9BILA
MFPQYLFHLFGIFTVMNAADHYSDLIKSEVKVIVDDLEIFNESENNTRINTKNFNPECQLSLHRNLCVNPKIDENETIGWNTRICFSWKCHNANYVMRVENCWTGSSHNPIYLIDNKGCSMEKTMIRTPYYESSLLKAHSIGWLSVRLVGVQHIRLSCSIRMCHLCDKNCPLITPPNNCADTPEMVKIPSIWNETEKYDQLCRPASIVKRLKNKAAATLTYSDSLWLVGAVIIVKLIFK